MDCELVITGFDSFSDIEENPSKIIVMELQNYLTNNIILSIANSDINVSFSFRILEVSVNGCQNFHESLYQSNGSSSNDKRYIFVHFGVDSKGKHIKLEQCAYNNMNFRIPDIQNYMPQNECIFTDQMLDSSLYSSLPIESLQLKCNDYLLQGIHKTTNEQQKQQQNYENKVILSIDPGRYLCNYIYYKALSSQSVNQLPLQSIFIHIPPFTEISKDEQLHVIQYLLSQLVEQIIST